MTAIRASSAETLTSRTPDSGLCSNGVMGVDEIVEAVRRALEPFQCVSFAYLFGSAVADLLVLNRAPASVCAAATTLQLRRTV